MTEATLAILYNQRVGAVDRIFSLLRRRDYPVGGITLERTHRPEIGRMTVLVTRSETVEQMTRHLSKLPDVVEVIAGDNDATRREFALARVCCRPDQRHELIRLLTAFHGQLLDVTAGHVVLEASGTSRQLDALSVALEPFGIEEIARTNPLAVGHSKAISSPTAETAH
jgi:acetolactate synthase-1/3 small subunit